MANLQPEIDHFSYYPLIAVRNSFLTIQWSVKKAFFVYINNGIGFRKTKGIKLTTYYKSYTYKIIAFGWFGVKSKEIWPVTYRVNKYTPQPQLTKKSTAVINKIDVNDSRLKTLAEFKQINKLKIKYKTLGICPDIETVKKELQKLEACGSTKDLEALNIFRIDGGVKMDRSQ